MNILLANILIIIIPTYISQLFIVFGLVMTEVEDDTYEIFKTKRKILLNLFPFYWIIEFILFMYNKMKITKKDKEVLNQFKNWYKNLK